MDCCKSLAHVSRDGLFDVLNRGFYSTNLFHESGKCRKKSKTSARYDPGLAGTPPLFPVFSLLGNPLIDMDLRNASMYRLNPPYCTAVPFHKRVSLTTFGSRLSTCYSSRKRRYCLRCSYSRASVGNFSPQSGSGACASFPFLSSTDYPIRRCTIQFVLRQYGIFSL